MNPLADAALIASAGPALPDPALPPADAVDVPTNGAILFARYAYPPNELGYCGPPDHRALLDYGAERAFDQGLVELARGFAGAWPYLEFIATSTGIGSPLDRRVVEAYWLGGAAARANRHGPIRKLAARSVPAARRQGLGLSRRGDPGGCGPEPRVPCLRRLSLGRARSDGAIDDAARAPRQVPDPVGSGRLDRRRPGHRPVRPADVRRA